MNREILTFEEFIEKLYKLPHGLSIANAYFKYLFSNPNYDNDGGRLDFINTDDTWFGWFSGAFIWDDTREGYAFWSHLAHF